MEKMVEKRYRNRSEMTVGAVKIDRRGDKNAVAIHPGESVLLNQEEYEATAQAPKNPADNPFAEQPVVIEDGEDDDGNIKYKTLMGPPHLEEVREDRTSFDSGTGESSASAGDAPDKSGSESEVSEGDVSEGAQGDVGAAPEPQTEAPEGHFAPGEEAGG